MEAIKGFMTSYYSQDEASETEKYFLSSCNAQIPIHFPEHFRMEIQTHSLISRRVTRHSLEM